MSDKCDASLRDGTLVRHRSNGYQGTIEGTTSIKACFTRGGAALPMLVTKEIFQYRISVAGESMRRIAPLEDLEILDAAAEINCVACQKPFHSKPGLLGKPCGHCACGGWICPVCLACQTAEAAQDKATRCTHQQKRMLRKFANDKKRSGRDTRSKDGIKKPKTKETIG
jgi:hypothetical protein